MVKKMIVKDKREIKNELGLDEIIGIKIFKIDAGKG